MKSDSMSVILFAGMLLFGIAANVIFLRMWSRLESIGQQPSSSLVSNWRIIKTLKLYTRLAPQNSWPSWFPAAFWISIFLGSASLLVLVHPWKA